MLRSGLAEVAIHPDGIVIRDSWKTRRLAWSEVRMFGVGALASVRSIAFLETVSGERIDLRAIQGTRWHRHDSYKVKKAVERLQAALEEARNA